MGQWIDLRSDTVTRPTPAMREAMYKAEVGDDVYREDPTLIALEALAAEMTGKEAGLFVTSGTMGNQLAVMAHTRRGDEVICEAGSHIYLMEVGGLAVLSGVQARPIAAERGVLSPYEVDRVIRAEDIHMPRTSLICIENTHNRAGGSVYTLEQLQALAAFARGKNLPIHMDGARVFNACVALKVPVKNVCQHADTAMFCLSKGLGAPVGSMLVGPREFIERARKFRKMLGGGMRQAGVLAAAGIIALRDMVDRLVEDHAHAKMLAEALADTGKLLIDPQTVETNIIIVDVSPSGMEAKEFIARLKTHGVKASQFGPCLVRFVTHLNIDQANIEKTIEAVRDILKE